MIVDDHDNDVTDQNEHKALDQSIGTHMEGEVAVVVHHHPVPVGGEEFCSCKDGDQISEYHDDGRTGNVEGCDLLVSVAEDLCHGDGSLVFLDNDLRIAEVSGQLPRPTANALEVGACNCPVV